MHPRCRAFSDATRFFEHLAGDAGVGDACPIFPGKRYEEWTVDDPACVSLVEVRPIRDLIERRVLALLDELQLDTATTSRTTRS